MFDRRAINSAILSLAPAHVARGLAPASFSDLMALGVAGDAEVAGQAEYFAEHGRFPMDQEQFTLEAIGQ